MITRMMTVIAVFMLVGTALCADEPARWNLSPEIKKSMLVEDWSKVAALIGEVKPETPVVLRFIKGHAGLALNQNDDSVFLFLLSTAAIGLDVWKRWSEAFSQEHPTVAIAHYFHGDSLARLQNYKEAVSVFERGLKLNPNHPLLLNARGVAYARLHRVSDARESFNAAIDASKQQLADAYGNLGAAWIQSQEGAEGAEAAFTRALDGSSGYALAAHGLLCVRMVLGKTEGLEELADRSVLFAKLDAITGENVQALIETAAARQGITIALNGELGTSLKRTYDGGPGDDLRDKLQSSFDHQARVSQSNLPNVMKSIVGKYQESKRGQVIADHALHYGVQATAEAIGKMDIRQQQSLQQNDMPKYAGRAKNFSGFTKGVGLASSVVAGGSVTALTKSKSAGALTAGATKMAYDSSAQRSKDLSALVLNVSSSMKAQFGPGSHPPAIPEPRGYAGTRTFPKQKPTAGPPPGYKPPSIPAPENYRGTVNIPGQVPGGANLSMALIKWDDGDWPFKPVYGLAYGLVPPNEYQPAEVKAQ